MRPTHSLEEERQALLEQIHASRVVYRRMWTQTDEPADTDNSDATYALDTGGAIVRQKDFPRSKTMKWVIHHPYLTALAAVAVVALGPRKIVTTVINRRTVTTGLSAVTTMLLRNPSKARLAGKAFSFIARFMRKPATRH